MGNKDWMGSRPGAAGGTEPVGFADLLEELVEQVPAEEAADYASRLVRAEASALLAGLRRDLAHSNALLRYSGELSAAGDVAESLSGTTAADQLGVAYGLRSSAETTFRDDSLDLASSARGLEEEGLVDEQAWLSLHRVGERLEALGGTPEFDSELGTSPATGMLEARRRALAAEPLGSLDLSDEELERTLAAIRAAGDAGEALRRAEELLVEGGGSARLDIAALQALDALPSDEDSPGWTASAALVRAQRPVDLVAGRAEAALLGRSGVNLDPGAPVACSERGLRLMASAVAASGERGEAVDRLLERLESSAEAAAEAVREHESSLEGLMAAWAEREAQRSRGLSDEEAMEVAADAAAEAEISSRLAEEQAALMEDEPGPEPETGFRSAVPIAPGKHAPEPYPSPAAQRQKDRQYGG